MASADFSIYAGDSRSLVVTVDDQNGAAVNITGATVKWVLVDSGGNTLLYKDTSANNGISITNAINGQCTISLTATDTQNLLAGSYTHEARLIDTSNNSSIIFKGTITVSASNV